MREALHGFTLRGRSFVAAGLTAVLCGIVLGEHDLVRIGALVALLPVFAALWVARSGNRLGLARTLGASQVEVGQRAVVHLELTNVGPTTGVLLIEEQIPWALGSRPRFVIDGMRPGWTRSIHYQVQAEVRGKYDIGPLRVRASDPFGLLELQRTFTKTAGLVVIPATEPLPPIPLLGAWTGTGDNRPRPFASGGAADVTVRDYRVGDDLRRVHWRSTAKVGSLMVRREEQPWQSRCTVFIDNRARVHRGQGPHSSIERAVTAAASLAVHLSAQGFQVRLVSALGEEIEHGWHDGDVAASPRPLLERLAVLPTVPNHDLYTGWVDESVTAGMCVAVLGDVDDHDRDFLARLHHRGSASYALVLDVDTWAARTLQPDFVRRPGRLPTAAWLRQHGWKAADLGRDGSLQTAWQELGR
ncbi:DUF58 domain-containing protein [Nocardioides pocheonensis]|uniref:DUF58 domain-containing protein n=1 Tax=Nocardioides pocheonensis TaxID=661485 RepID=A0A3N0GVL6_9ACTN|nr:DUF58 domain-containing protein [Nocardioides pocheonensis]